MCFVLCDQYEMPDVCIIWQKKKKKNAGKNINIVLSTLIYGKDHFFHLGTYYLSCYASHDFARAIYTSQFILSLDVFLHIYT